MSPGGVLYLFDSDCFPRVSGDEPWSVPLIQVATLFSPRERG